MELNLHQSIKLATKAHEGQWRSPTNASITDFESERKEILKSGGSYILKNGSHLYEDKDDKYIWKIRKPYITHPLAVMELMDTEEEKIVAILHDVFEKCPGWCLGRIMDDSKFYIKDRSENIEYITTANVYWALMLISKHKHIPYADYIQKLINNIKLDGTPNKLAIKVKLADILSNLSDNPSNYAKQKYLKALPILLKGI